MTEAPNRELVPELNSWLQSWAAERVTFRSIDETCRIPTEVIEALANRGLLGMMIDREFGGLGLPVPQALESLKALGSIDLGLATFVANHSIATFPIARHALDPYSNRHIRDFAVGRRFAAVALSEPATGADLDLIATEAKRNASGTWLINGVKTWIGPARTPDVFVVVAKDSTSAERPALSAFLVPLQSEGLRIDTDPLKMGMPGLVRNRVFFEDVTVAESALLGERFRGRNIARECITLNRLFLVAASIGAMRRSLQLAKKFADRQPVCTGTLSQSRLFSQPFHRHTQRAVVLETMLEHVALRLHMPEAGDIAAYAKMLAGEFLWECVDFATQGHAARGYHQNDELALMLRDARGFRMLGSPTEALATSLGFEMFDRRGALLGFIEAECRHPRILGTFQSFLRRLDSGTLSAGLVREVGCNRLGQLAALTVAACSPALLEETAKSIMFEQRLVLFTFESEIALEAGGLPSPDSYDVIFPEWRTWNATDTVHADMSCIHDLFTHAASQDPQKPAVRCAGKELSYAELARRSNRLASSLQTAGVCRGSIVGIALPRSTDAVVAMIAVLKCGAAYLPLDPGLPNERLRFMLEEAGTTVVIASGSELNPARFQNTRLVAMTESVEEAPSSTPLPVSTTPADLAYVIFTSGSTGNPKGAMLPHEGVVNWMLWMRRTFSVTKSDFVLWKAVVGFDHSVWECFLPLICGATLVIAESGREADWDYLSDLIESEQVTLMQFVPSVLGRFLEQTTPKKCRSVRHVMSGGEALSPSLVHRFYEKITNGKLCNAYGPTEASIGVTMFPCPRSIEGDFVPIGPPIDNVKIHILDAAMRPVPVGEAGELYIQGGLARGYVNRPALTAERFVKSPFDSQILYKTGDLASWLPDGNLRFIGRVDNQVKVRGLRIELEEIEAVLKGHPDIEEAAAAIAGREERASLWCYFKRRRGSGLGKEQVRGYLESRLPSYMVPSRVLEVDRFPLIASGKIDRRALLDAKPIEESPVAEPAQENSSELDMVLDEWRRILNVSTIRLSDDFYDLGGNSLLLSVLLVFLKKQFNLNPPGDLNRLRTVSSILECLKMERAAGSGA